MYGLSSIPEPSTNAPPPEPDEPAVRLPTGVPIDEPVEADQSAKPTQDQEKGDAENQIDNVAILLVLLIAGALLRIVLGLLGPLQGIDETRIESAQQNGRDILAGQPADAYPLVDLMSLGLASTGMPAWILVVLGSVFTLVAIPAAYVIGRALTGRPVAGIVAAAIVAVHPAVLTAANSFDNTAIALGLLTAGLATLCLIEKRGSAAAMVGGILLGLAGLAAPLCWLVGTCAGPTAFKFARKAGTFKALSLGVIVTFLALAPAAAYRGVFLGSDPDALLSEWAGETATDTDPLHQLLVGMTSPSFEALGEAMHLPLGDAGQLKIANSPTTTPDEKRDVVADALADGWLLINAALAGLAAVSAGVLLARRRFAEALLLTAPLVAIAFTTLPPSEALRLPMIALVGVLATGLLATRSVPNIDQEAIEAKRLAKQTKQEAKEHVKQERELKKHKESLYAFDNPKKPKCKQKQKTEDPASSQAPGILSQHDEDIPAMPGRVI